jgi:hypothetical protein
MSMHRRWNRRWTRALYYLGAAVLAAGALAGCEDNEDEIEVQTPAGTTEIEIDRDPNASEDLERSAERMRENAEEMRDTENRLDDARDELEDSAEEMRSDAERRIDDAGEELDEAGEEMRDAARD